VLRGRNPAYNRSAGPGRWAKVTATLKDGVLELEMPKGAPPKKIKVEAKAA
jgi:hypothetical protein